MAQDLQIMNLKVNVGIGFDRKDVSIIARYEEKDVHKYCKHHRAPRRALAHHNSIILAWAEAIYSKKTIKFHKLETWTLHKFVDCVTKYENLGNSP